MGKQERAIILINNGYTLDQISRIIGVKENTAKTYLRLASKSSGGPRMEQAVKLWAEGLDHAAIAARMNITKATAKTHVLRARLRGDSRAKARQ